jgi:predicted GNAT family acetyltransferase
MPHASYHAGVDSAFEGQGVGGRATAAMLDFLRSSGEMIVPLCSFVHSYIERNPTYGDLVDHELYDEYR